MESDDEFPFSQEDEAELLALEGQAQASNNKKRKAEDEDADGPQSKKIAVKTYPTKSQPAVQVLQSSFGMQNFRLEQEAVIARILAGGSAAVVFPTGGGKSLCFQIPALLFEEQDKLGNDRRDGEHGVTIVVSPLISLMKDQCDALVRRGLSSRTLDSTKLREEVAETHEMLQNGALKLLYCAPERLNNEGFVHRMAQVKGGVRMIAVDEAHCISEWGHAFRPDYLKVARFAEEIRAERVICLTATATPKVAQDICDKFNIDSGGLFRTSTYRSNLQILVEGGKTKQELYPRLFQFLKQNRGSSIVYVTLQKQTEELADDLRSQGFKAEAFHAGLDTKTKTDLQDRFMKSDNLIIVATIAFGMGIDKDNVRNIVHFNIPSSIESYSQEIGRAGRDGKTSKCLFYVCGEDLYLRELFARGDLPSKQSLRRLLEDIQTESKARKVGELLKVYHSVQSKNFDFRPTTLNNIYAQLELLKSMGFIRATTPEYSKYEYKAGPKFSDVATDSSSTGTAIKSSATFGRIKYTLDIGATADAFQSAGISRGDLIRKLNDWNDKEAIELTASGVVNVYRIMKKFPSTPGALDAIVEELYSLMEAREKEALERTEGILNLMTSAGCYTHSLAQHFGDHLPDNKKECGHCSWCTTHKAIERQDPPLVPFNNQAFRAVLDAVEVRDDPRFLTRVAFGISSPRITAMRLGKSPVFMSMMDHGFETLLKKFTEVCNAEGSRSTASSYTIGNSSANSSAPPPPRVKSNYKKDASSSKPASRETSTRGRGRGSRGGRAF